MTIALRPNPIAEPVVAQTMKRAFIEFGQRRWLPLDLRLLLFGRASWLWVIAPLALFCLTNSHCTFWAIECCH